MKCDIRDTGCDRVRRFYLHVFVNLNTDVNLNLDVKKDNIASLY